MKRFLYILPFLSFSVYAQELVDIEAKKAKIQNAFESVTLDIKQDELCTEKFANCMDQVCSDPRVHRCICSTYFDSIVLPRRTSLLKMQEQTEQIINKDIPAMQAGNENNDEIELIEFGSMNMMGNKGDFLQTGEQLFNKGLNSCKSIAQSCSATGLTSKISANYTTKINNTCVDYLNHLNKEGETIEYENIQAVKMKKTFQSLVNGGDWNLTTCEGKLKEYFVKDCQGFDYKNCMQCKDIDSEANCKKEVVKNFNSKKDRASKELVKNCGEDNFDSAFKNFMSEINGSFSMNFRKTQKSADDKEAQEIKDWTNKLTACATSSCELDWSQCEEAYNIETILNACDEVKKMKVRYEENPDLITSAKKKAEIEVLKKAKTRRQF